MMARRPLNDPEAGEAPATVRLSPREYQRLKKQRQRARRYDAGLKADGTPVTNPDLSFACRTKWRPKHPEGCGCYDCLYGET